MRKKILHSLTTCLWLIGSTELSNLGELLEKESSLTMMSDEKHFRNFDVILYLLGYDFLISLYQGYVTELPKYGFEKNIFD